MNTDGGPSMTDCCTELLESTTMGRTNVAVVGAATQVHFSVPRSLEILA
jgi:hypothetical protein